VFGPRNLGGYEVQIEQRDGTVGRLSGLPEWAMTGERLSADRRLGQALRAIGPSYTVLTVVLALAFLSAGVAPLTAAVQAAGVMATCGLTLGEGGFRGGLTVEMLALLFMIVAATRHGFARGGLLIRLRRFRGDPEIDLAAFTVAVAAGWVLLRGLKEPAIGLSGESIRSGLEAAWAAVFTTASFLSTTGYVSDFWQPAHDHVGLQPPGMLLMALAAMGGGVASTAGGVKLLRSFALFQHGMAEMHQLGHPSAVSARGEGVRRVGFAGAMLAWLFLMLFLLAIGVTALVLSLGGAGLDTSLAAAIAANTNTGAVYAAAAGDAAPSLAGFAPADRLTLCIAMILGRVEVLAVVALANPAYWRG
jgi:trk system potassium uptake protein TrkH